MAIVTLHLNVDPRSGYPLYLQIVEQVQRAIAIGVLVPGQQLPTVKQLASDLVINPSTIAKALRELEHLHVVTSRPGRGSYVSDNGTALAAQQTAEGTVAKAVDRAVREARSLAIEGQVLRGIFERAYLLWYTPVTTETPRNDT